MTSPRGDLLLSIYTVSHTYAQDNGHTGATIAILHQHRFIDVDVVMRNINIAIAMLMLRIDMSRIVTSTSDNPESRPTQTWEAGMRLRIPASHVCVGRDSGLS